MGMKVCISVVVFSLALLPISAGATLENSVKICGDPLASPRDVVWFCSKALETGKLKTRAEAQVRLNMGVGHFDLGNFQAAEREYSQALALAPDITEGYLNRARVRERLGMLNEALADYDEVLRRKPGAADAYLGRGTLLVSHGDPARAIADLSQAIRLRPTLTAAHYNRGVAHRQVGDNARAADDFSSVIRLNGSDAAAYLNRGEARAALNQRGALADFDQAIRLQPEWSVAWFARGRYWDAQGNREAANADFLRADELGYSDPWLIQRIREISS